MNVDINGRTETEVTVIPNSSPQSLQSLDGYAKSRPKQVACPWGVHWNYKTGRKNNQATYIYDGPYRVFIDLYWDNLPYMSYSYWHELGLYKKTIGQKSNSLSYLKDGKTFRRIRYEVERTS